MSSRAHDPDEPTPPQGLPASHGPDRGVPTPPYGSPVTPPGSTPAGATVPHGVPTPPAGAAHQPDRHADAGRASGFPDTGREQRRSANTPLRAVPDTPPRHRRSFRARVVGLARVLTGGLIVLALVVLVAPLVLGGGGAGLDAVVGHLAGALVALAATGLAAHRRTPPGVALAAAAAVPVIVLVVLAVFWWS